MALISLQDITLAFGGPLVFDQINLQLERGERVAMLGRNGVGKTTLMKVMAGQVEIDGGEIIYQKNIKITHLPQEVPNDLTGTVFDIVFSGLGPHAKLLSDYHHITHRLQTEQTPHLLRELDRLQDELNHSNGWDLDAQVEDVLLHMKLNGEDDFETLSGGQKRRVLLAKALVIKPEILMLDEPTNHLDIDTINWLEDLLKNYPGTLFFVTHDRMFMQRLATRIIELDRGGLFNWSCDYPTFLERKQAALEIEAVQRAEFGKKLAEEEVWIRKGIKARRTRNEGRVRALEKMREEKKAQRQQIGQARIQAQETGASGRQVIKAENLNFSYEDTAIIKDFSTQIMRGDKIGVIGANGCGKTTLLRILMKQLQPQSGTVKMGTNLEGLYYDQLREQLDEEKSVIENVASGDTVMINGRARHVIGYLQDFLFTPERARTPVKVLSGGERNRLFLARLFTKPSNFLVMDEPTNDLDIETQELLEELLMEYSGTLILVSHDRVFLNNVVTSTLVFEGEGEICEYAGGYDDWLSQRKTSEERLVDSEKDAKSSLKKKDKPVEKRKRSFKENQELERLVVQIQSLEEEQVKLCALMAEPSFYQKDPQEIVEIQQRSKEISESLPKIYQRWESLESL